PHRRPSLLDASPRRPAAAAAIDGTNAHSPSVPATKTARPALLGTYELAATVAAASPHPSRRQPGIRPAGAVGRPSRAVPPRPCSAASTPSETAADAIAA